MGDIDKMIAHTGCDAVMIGRAARGNPWIFARQVKEDLSGTEICATISDHVVTMVDYYGERLGLRLFRKHLKHYLAGMDVNDDALIGRLLGEEYLEGFIFILLELETAIQSKRCSSRRISDSKALSIVN